MGFLFRKRVKIFPGLWFNLSKRGVSTSIGGKGLTVNIKGDKVRATASLPGTGLSYRTSTIKTDDPAQQGASIWKLVLLLLIVVGIVLLVR